jgi:hypothetical protein
MGCLKEEKKARERDVQTGFLVFAKNKIKIQSSTFLFLSSSRQSIYTNFFYMYHFSFDFTLIKYRF